MGKGGELDFGSAFALYVNEVIVNTGINGNYGFNGFSKWSNRYVVDIKNCCYVSSIYNTKENFIGRKGSIIGIEAEGVFVPLAVCLKFYLFGNILGFAMCPDIIPVSRNCIELNGRGSLFNEIFKGYVVNGIIIKTVTKVKDVVYRIPT